MARHKHVVSNRKAMSWMLITVLVGFLLELMGGWMTHSLGVMSDAFHMLSDGFSQLTFWIILTLAIWSQHAPKWLRKRRHLHRGVSLLAGKEETLSKIGDTVNLLLLLGAASFTGIMAIKHLAYPETVHAVPSMVIATVGLLVNVINLLIFTTFKAKKDLKSVYRHVLGDLYHSIIVIVSLAIVSIFGEAYQFVDALLSLWLCKKMFTWSWELTRELLQSKTFHMQGVTVSFPSHTAEACGCEDHEHGHQEHAHHAH